MRFVLFIAHYMLPYNCMFYSAEQMTGVCVWGGDCISASRSNHFALWLVSNSIFCQLASHTPTPKRTQWHNLHRIVHSITHASPQAGSTYLLSHSYTHGQKTMFFCCCCCCCFISFGWHSLISIKGDFQIHFESICSHSLWAILPVCALHTHTLVPPLRLIKYLFHGYT